MIEGLLTEKALESAFSAVFTAIPAMAKKGKALLNRNSHNIYRKIQTISKVKTLLDNQKEYDVIELYHPVKILIETSKKISVTSISDFGDAPRIVLEGTGGQGKSFFLKYLTIKEIPRGRWIPVFCELRRKKIGESLVDFVIRKCQEYELSLTKQDLEKLLSNGRIALILDGYDEVRYDERSELVADVEELAEKFRDVPIIISTRPYTGLSWSTYFKKAKITPFSFEDARTLLSKLVEDENVLKELLEAVRKNRSVKELLTTPLLVVLLAVTYQVQREIPGSLIDFYERLFSVLFYMHDNTKVDYQRERRYRGAEYSLRSIIEGVAFNATRERVSRFNKDNLSGFVRNAAEAAGLASVNEDEVIGDLVHALCLLLEDGFEEYEFFHKSVQEYFAAKFVRRLSDGDVRRFYRTLSADKKELWQWRGTLSFLRELESERFDEYFLLPVLRKFAIEPDGVAKTVESIVINIVGKVVHYGVSRDGGVNSAAFEDASVGFDFVCEQDKRAHLFHHCMSYVSERVKKNEKIGKTKKSGIDRDIISVRIGSNKELVSLLVSEFHRSGLSALVLTKMNEAKRRISLSKKGKSALTGLGGLR